MKLIAKDNGNCLTTELETDQDFYHLSIKKKDKFFLFRFIFCVILCIIKRKVNQKHCSFKLVDLSRERKRVFDILRCDER